MSNKDNVVKVLSFHLDSVLETHLTFEAMLNLLISSVVKPERVKIDVREVAITDMKEYPNGRVGFLGVCDGVAYSNQFDEYKTDIWGDLGFGPNEFDYVWVSETKVCYWKLEFVKLRFQNDSNIRSSLGKLYDEVLAIESDPNGTSV